MRIKALVVSAILSGLVIGCANVPPKGGQLDSGDMPPQTIFNTTRCNEDGCLVHIRVTGDCTFALDPYIKLSGTVGEIHGVVWVIKSKDYVFSTNSGAPALFPKTSGDTFFGTTAVIGRLLAVEVNVASPSKVHAYGLNIAKRGGGPCTKIDPFMVE
jgi:hypothetical protein